MASWSSNGVPAWPVGRLMESQHGLLVVQGSISMACWSSDGVLAWPAGRPREYQHSLLVVPAQLSVPPKRHTHDANDSWKTFVQVEVVKC